MRTGTKAADHFADDVPYETKQRRNNELLAVQNAISEQDNHSFIEQTVDVLVEGPSKASRKNPDANPVMQLMGRTHCDRIVVFDGYQEHIGQILPFHIYDATPHTLFGRPVQTVDPVGSVQIT